MPRTLSKEKLALILILLCAAALRLSLIGWTLPNQFHTATYNPDEATVFTALQGINPSKLDFNPVSDKMPHALYEGTFNLYTYGGLLKLLSTVKLLTLNPDKGFYYAHIGEMAKLYLAGRLLSVFYGLLTVWVTYLLAKKLSGERAGLLAAFFMAVMPAHVIYSRYILMNVPGTFWIVLAFIFLTDIIRRGSTRDYFLAGMSIGLATATRYSAAPLFLILILAHILRGGAWRERKKAAAGFAALFLFYFIVSPYTLLDFPDFLAGMRFLNTQAAGDHALSFQSHVSLVSAAFTEALGPALLFISAGGVALAFARRAKETLLLLAWISILILFFFLAGPLVSPGRILPALPFLLILGAEAVDLAWRRSAAAGIFALVTVIAQTAVYSAAYFRLISPPDIRDTASAWMAENIRPGSSIGLLREPSWFSPGLVDRKYRHPEHTGLPDYKYIPLTSVKWRSQAGFDLLPAATPEYILVTEFESRDLQGGDLAPAAAKYGYREIKDFRASLALPGLPFTKKIPDMLYIPDKITVFQRFPKP